MEQDLAVSDFGFGSSSPGFFFGPPSSPSALAEDPIVTRLKQATVAEPQEGPSPEWRHHFASFGSRQNQCQSVNGKLRLLIWGRRRREGAVGRGAVNF